MNGRNKTSSKNCWCLKTNITKTTNAKQATLLMHLTLCRQLLMHLSKINKLDLEKIAILSEISRIHEIHYLFFLIANLTTVLPNEGESTEDT